MPSVSSTDFPTRTLTDNPGVITEEARQASIEKYRAGLVYYTDGNYEKAKENFQAALQLNPENSDAALGLKRIEERYNNR